jgi:hypothetical protein
MERVMEVASHPLSLLVYCIFAIFAVLWAILDRQARKSNARLAMLRSRPIETAPVAPHTSPPRKRARVRTRVRVRRRTHA